MRVTYKILGLLLLLLAINFGANHYFWRWDLTKDGRFTLAKATKEVLQTQSSKIHVQVFLDGELPPEFLKLKVETKQLLEEFSATADLTYEFVNPIDELSPQESQKVMAALKSKGVRAAMATVLDKGKKTNITILPYAMVSYRDKSVAVPLLSQQIGGSTEERVNSSVQKLEYHFADGFKKVLLKNKKTIAILRDSGNLSDRQLASFIKGIQEYYTAARFGVEFVHNNDSISPGDVLTELQKFDLVVAPKPTVAYSETKKYLLDQYLMTGGKLLLAIDPIVMENDSLSNAQRKAYALPRDLSLDEQLFRYGLRLNKSLLKDRDSGPIALAVGQGRNTQYEAFEWPYYVTSNSTIDTSAIATAIIKNIPKVKLEYTGSIDTLKTAVKKTILLSSSTQSQSITLPAAVQLSEINQPLDTTLFVQSPRALAVLAQGKFISAYKNRVKPFALAKPHDEGIKEGAIFLLADGDILKNQLDQGRPQDLGYDIRTGVNYGNKEFLLNTINYMLNDDQLVQIRNKDIQLPLLDQKASYDDRLYWQLLNMILPLLILFVIGAGIHYYRRKKYQ